MSVFGGFSAGIKPGMVIPWANFTEVPDGFLLCDGAAVSRELYSELFSVIGTIYGEGDGSTTFNLPNGVLRLLSKTPPVVGNGLNLGFSTGEGQTGCISYSGSPNWDIRPTGGAGSPIGTTSPGGSNAAGKAYGITTDPALSGLMVDLTAYEISLLIKF